MKGFTIRQLGGFDELGSAEEAWPQVLRSGPTNVIFLTKEWQATWWECFGRGELHLLAAESDGRIEAIAPMFYDSGMVYFVGSGGSDYLDFVGNFSRPEVLASLLLEVRHVHPDFMGFLFYHVPNTSPTGALLRDVATCLGLVLTEEGGMRAPVLDLSLDPDRARAATRKQSLLRHERYFRRTGTLEVIHAWETEEIVPDLDAFFDQHTRRWRAVGQRGHFEEPSRRRFFRHLAQLAGKSKWLRFTKISHDGQPIAFHYGFMYEGEYFWYKPSFEIALAKHSPGELLIRQLLLAAISEGAHTFDFGLGEEPFKRRFASRCKEVRNWGLYDPRVMEANSTAETPVP